MRDAIVDEATRAKMAALARQDGPFPHWDLLMMSPRHADTARQVAADLAGGRLVMLDRTAPVQDCEEVSWNHGRRPCPAQAAVLDTVRGRRNCPGCAFSFADDRLAGRAEYPSVDQYDGLGAT